MDLMTYTIDDLNAAKLRLDQLEERDSQDTSGNPEKYHTRIAHARRELYNIEKSLKAAGTVARSEQEEIEHQLDLSFPTARSKEIVEFDGERYQRRFRPLTQSRSRKSVTSWDAYWVKVTKNNAGA